MSSTRFNPPVPVFSEVNPTTGETSPEEDGTLIPGENDYESLTNKQTLRSYISNLTRGLVPPVVASPNRGIIEYNGPTPDHGNAYPLGDGRGLADSTFTEFGVEGGSNNELQDYSDSGLFNGPNDGSLDGIIKKGALGRAHGRETLSGHLLLQGVIGQTTSNGNPQGRTEGAAAYLASIPEILSDNNLNSPAARAAVSGSASSISSRVSVERGDEILSRSPSPTAERISVEDLSKVALDIMLNASGKPIKDSTIPNVPGGSPSTSQMGFSQVDSVNMQAASSEFASGLSSTLDGTGPVDLPTSDGVGEDRYSNKSFGVTYNPLESFTAIDSSVTSFGILAGAAFGAVLATGGLLSLTDPPNRPTYPNIRDSSKKLEMGRFKFGVETEPGFLQSAASAVGIETDITKLLNIHLPTNGKADYGQCVIIGFASLIGTSFNDDSIFTDRSDGTRVISAGKLGLLSLLIAARFLTIAATGEKGYYMNLFKEIVKDAGSIVTSIGSDPRSLLSGGISNILGTKLIRFVDVLAQVGDAVASQSVAIDYYDSRILSDPDNVYSTFDPGDVDSSTRKKMIGFGSRRIYGDRFINRRGAEYSIADIPSYHLIPNSNGQLYYSQLGTSNIAKRIKSVRPESVDGRLRFTPEQVSQVESVLEAEYMPFYFQDVRTNEIISFHAFLEDLSDSYSAEYNSTSGYGRIEDIKSYKSTKRSVGCTFHVVATNPQDFNYMWWQINKLTTLVYPQWSKGRDLTTDDGFKFTQPFSQLPTATPLIRIRVGDLIRSNYSRFNLKRLFGWQDSEKQQSTAGGPELTTTETVSVGSGVSVYRLKVPYEKLFREYGPAGAESDLFMTSNSDGVIVTERFIQGDTPGYKLWTITEGFNAGKTIKVLSNENDVQLDLSGLGRKISASTATSNKTNSQTFYEPKNNTIVKSFESTRGLGLAAVVTQLQFTWMDGLWGAGDDGPGNRAPRTCKVQMNFEPIHDIAPGLDHEGFNRAPIYPVGDLINSIVEGGEPEPYGAGTSSRFDEQRSVASNKTEYEDANKQTPKFKIF
jgi:hypothetical protein